MDRVIDYFLHIPKTAGTSLTRILDSNYKPEEILPQQTWVSFLAQYPVDTTQVRLVRGHFGDSIKRLFPTAQIRYLTMLRDPVERVISSYHHIATDFKNGTWSLDFQFDTLDRLLETQPNVFSNKQVRHLAVDVFHDTGQSWETLYEKACHRLRECAWFGFLETFNHSISELCSTMGWPQAELPHLNRLANRPETASFPPETLAKVRALNEWDIRLYEYAQLLKSLK